MKTINIGFLLVSVLFNLTILNSEAQQTILSKSVFGSGGGKMTSSSYILNGTVGQPLIGLSNDNSVQAEAGFWNTKMVTITSINDFSDNLNPGDEIFFEAFPNPFKTTISLRLILRNQEKISLKIYNSSGNEIETIVEETLRGNEYNYYFNAGELSNGIYYCRIVSDNINLTKKLSLIR